MPEAGIVGAVSNIENTRHVDCGLVSHLAISPALKVNKGGFKKNRIIIMEFSIKGPDPPS